jgi:hypothetical protein
MEHDLAQRPAVQRAVGLEHLVPEGLPDRGQRLAARRGQMVGGVVCAQDHRAQLLQA